MLKHKLNLQPNTAVDTVARSNRI